jgi:MOSC domain-containing protein YiiM
MSAAVVAIFLNKASRIPLVRVERARALADQGLEGDRHARPGQRRSVLLMALEDLGAFGLAPGDVREQITVRDLALHALPEGARLKIAGTLLEVGEPCAPCARMDELRPGLRQAIDGRRGRFARVIEAGEIVVGEPIRVEAMA